jgi:ABC-2 type transport system permease protein
MLDEWLTIVILIVVGLLALIGLATAIWGLFDARSLLRRELSAYFLSPIAYVVSMVFLSVTGYLFYHTLDKLTTRGPEGAADPMQYFFMGGKEDYHWIFWLVFVLIPPVLTMRLFAEERASGTLEMLMTAPIRDWQLVLCKYTAALIFYVVLWLPTLVYIPALLDVHFAVRWPNSFPFHVVLLLAGPILLLIGLLMLIPRLGTGARVVSLLLVVLGIGLTAAGWWLDARAYMEWRQAFDQGKTGMPEPYLITLNSQIDPFPVLTSYIGIFLAGAMLVSIGIFVSSLVRNQLVAFLISVGISLPLMAAAFVPVSADRGGLLYQLVSFFSVPIHFDRSFGRGILDTRNLVFYASVALFCLFLTVRNMESRRWR